MKITTTTISRIAGLAAVAALVATSWACESRRGDKPTARPPRTADAAQPAPDVDNNNQPPKSPNNGAAVSPIKLTWSLSRAADGASLTLDYEIENLGDDIIFVVDDHASATAKGLEIIPTAVAILPGADSNSARLVAGHVPLPPGHASEVVPIAPAHELAAKAKRSGTKTVPLPLKGWIESEGRVVDLSKATRATFEVTWLRPPPADRADWAWEVQKDAAGKTIRTPFLGYVNTMGGQSEAGPVAIP
jgi:hypothetical protein